MDTIPPLKVTLERKNDNYFFEAKGKTGTPVLIDNTSQEGAQGASPMELLLMGVGGCSAIDIIFILQKQRQKITSYKVTVAGDREPIKEAKPFSKMQLSIYLEGDIDPAKAKRAAQLSFDKYCSVSLTFGENLPISYAVYVNGILAD